VNLLHLATTESSEGDLLGGSSRRSHRPKTDENLLLTEIDRVGQGVRSHIHTTSKGITLVLEEDLLDLELTHRQGSGDRANETGTEGNDGVDGVQFHDNLNLLGEQVRRQGREFAEYRRDTVGQREPAVGITSNVRATRISNGIATESQ
jgi:hypothetical protein